MLKKLLHVKEKRKRELLQHRVQLNIYISLGCDTGMGQSSADRIPVSLHNLRTVILMANLRKYSVHQLQP